MCDKNYSEESKEKKVYKILNIINQILDEIQISILSETFGIISSEKIRFILDKNEIHVDEKNIDKIIIKKNKSITIEDFNNPDNYYDILYKDYFLPKIYNFTTKNTILFKTINEVYYYKKFIKYITNFLKKNPECLVDDIMKDKIYEIINCLDSDDKLYTYDFYFYISMMNIEKIYQKNDIQKPEFEPLNLININNVLTVIRDIQNEKTELIDLINKLVIIRNQKSNLIKYIKDMYNEVVDSSKLITILMEQFKNIKNEDFKLDIFLESEKKFIKYIEFNKSNDEVLQLMKDLDANPEIKDKFEFYYMGKINEFLSLSKEHIYLIIHSYHNEKKIKNYKFNQHVLNYIDQFNSYNEGIKNDLKEEIKEIIESNEFFSLIKDIYNSKTIKEYCKNPIQYLKQINSNEVDRYYERDEEIASKKKALLKEINRKVTKFTIDNIQNNEENKEFKNENNKEDNEIPDLNSFFTEYNNELLDINDLKDIDEKEAKCQLYIDYTYFMDKIFNKNFFKERIVYSYLPVAIKGFVSNIPKIILNISGNSISMYKLDKKSREFKIVLTALLVCIIIHEIIHMIRRENTEKILENDQYTPNEKDKIYEGGKSLIFHIFGVFAIVYINLEFAETILDINCWNNNGKLLKEKYSKLGTDEKAKKKYVELNGGIKCYNSEEQEEKYYIEENDFYYYYCC